jgi:hypothetical protein
MSIKIMTLAWQIQLPARDKLVLLALADNANDEGECFPSIATISKRACTDERRLYRILHSLEEAKQITRVSRPGRSTLYRVHPTPGTEATPGTETRAGTETRPPLAQVPATPGTGATHNHHLTSSESSRRAASGGLNTSSVRDPAGEEAPDESTLDKALFAEARKVFGKSIGGQINTAIREKGKPWVLGVIETCRTKDPEAARAYLAAALKGRNPDQEQQRKVVP